MKYLKDFLENNQKSEIFNILNCTQNELKILKLLLEKYILGVSSLGCYELLSAIKKPKAKDFSHLELLDDVKNLMDLGYVLAGFNPFLKERQNTSKLGLLNAELALSENFLHLIENSSTTKSPSKEPYIDHLEYLKDQFLRVELYVRRLNQNAQKSDINQKIKSIEKAIGARLKISKTLLPCEQIFKDNNLDVKEQVIFLALLKEEYGEQDSGSLRELGTLLGLISDGEMDRMKNRSLLEDGGRLVESGIVEYDEILTPFGSVSRNFFIAEDTLSAIMHPKSSSQAKKMKLKSIVKNSEIFELIEPNSDLSDVVLNEKTKDLIGAILSQLDKKVQNRLANWGIKASKGVDAKVIFYGPPGTGKTMSALSLAKSLKKQVLSFDCSKILSKYVGESEQNVRKIFDSYREICDKTKSAPVLLLNEADQFLSARSDVNVSGSEKMHNQMQNIFLEQIEKFQGVLIATTNFLQSLDHAFSRRFDYKIEFKKPSFDERVQIWQKVLPKNARFEKAFSVEDLAKYELSGAQIVLVMKSTALKTAISQSGIFTLECFANEIKTELSSAFGDDKKVGLL